jgi:glycosyltransferase involved in cell wall biosynthesis
VREATPTVSIGLPVRNGAEVLRRCIESVLSQGVSDLELVVSDNVSDDGTRDLLEEYARADNRVRVGVNAVNIGLHENVNRVLECSRGTFFRWISADDWLESEYLSTCLRVLTEQSQAIGVTTQFTIHTPDGGSRCEQYLGDFPSSPDAATRFERMLWFFHAGDGKYDPVYGLYRRQALLRTGRIRPSEQADWLLAAELALTGPILHVDRPLANRTRSYPVLYDLAARRRRLDPVRGEELRSSPTRLYRDLLELVIHAGLTEEQVQRCKRALRRFWLKDVVARGHFRLARARERIPVRRGTASEVAKL